MSNPVRGQQYTLREVFNLNLRDSPHLGVTIDGKDGVIQNSHLTEEEMLTIPGFADTKWTYRYETDEWIPIFQYAKLNPPIENFVDHEPAIDAWSHEETDELWIIPKGFPREQYLSSL